MCGCFSVRFSVANDAQTCVWSNVYQKTKIDIVHMHPYLFVSPSCPHHVSSGISLLPCVARVYVCLVGTAVTSPVPGVYAIAEEKLHLDARRSSLVSSVAFRLLSGRETKRQTSLSSRVGTASGLNGQHQLLGTNPVQSDNDERPNIFHTFIDILSASQRSFSAKKAFSRNRYPSKFKFKHAPYISLPTILLLI